MHFFQPKLIQLLSTSILLLLPSNHILLNFKKCQKITNFPKTLILTKKSKNFNLLTCSNPTLLLHIMLQAVILHLFFFFFFFSQALCCLNLLYQAISLTWLIVSGSQSPKLLSSRLILSRISKKCSKKLKITR